ncbi:MAG: histidine phosphatase family protein [Pseudomonadota bacterium]
MARRLLLMRHAKSSWDSAVARDFDRPLNKRGHKAGKHMGAYLHKEGLSWDVLLVSPAERTRQTVERLEAGYGETLAPLYDDRLYMASATQLLAVLRNLDDIAQTVMLIAHNPGIQGLALSLVARGGRKETDRARIESKYPTAALTVIDFTAANWNKVAPAGGALERFVKPKDLKKAKLTHDTPA